MNYSPGITAGSKTDAAGDDIAEYVAATKTVTFRMGNGATGTNGGYLALADSFEVQFKVTVNNPANGIVPPIINVARLKANSDALVAYVDDGTAVLSPMGGPLPVTLTAFTATLQSASTARVSWTTSMEINCKNYNVERSTDGVLFTSVADVSGNGNSSLKHDYTINDDVMAVTSAIVYYRLKQFDIDGRASISKVVSIRLKKTVGDFTVSPNPFRSKVNINIEWDKNETTVVKVFNMGGTVAVSKSVKMIKGFNYVSMDELSQVPAGTYIVQFVTANGMLTKQIIKEQ